MTVLSKLGPLTGRAGNAISPSKISIDSMNRHALQDIYSAEIQLVSEREKPKLYAGKSCVEVGIS
jgi:hypothetical protein